MPVLFYRRELSALMLLGLPLVGSQLAQVSIQIVDTLMLGRYSVEALAAVVLASSLFFSTFIVGSGLAWAVTPLVAAAAAREDWVRVRRVTRMGLWASLIFSALVVPILLSGGAIFRALGQAPELAELAQDYLRIAAWGMPPALIVMLLKAYLAGVKRTAIVMWVTIGASVLNALLNWLLIFGALGFPELGVEGAAIASVTMHSVSLIALAVYAQRILPDLTLFARLWRPDWAEFRQVVALGWPIGVASLAETGLFSASAIMVGWIGATELAAHGIALQLATVTFMVHLGLSHAATVLAGEAVGRGDPLALRRGAVAGLLASGLVAAVTVAIMVTIPGQLLSLFVDPADPVRDAILAVGIGLVIAAAVFQAADGGQVMLISLLRGMQDTRVPMVLASVSYWGVGAPLGYVLGIVLGIGALGVWAGLVAGLFCAALLLGWRFWRRQLPQFAATGALARS